MKSGNIPSDDPRVGFLKKLSQDDLKKAGINSNVGEDGKTYYKFQESAVSQEEITSRLNARDSSALTNNRGRVISTHDASLHPTERALLDTIASGESPDYNTITSGGGKFESYADHPRKRVGSVNSDAAGRYQFLSSSWDGVVKKYNAENPQDPIKDFSPRNQDRAALWLAKQDYSRRTGRDLLEDLRSTDPETRKQIGALLKSGLGGQGNATTWQAFQTRGSEHWQNEYESNLKRNQDYQTARNRPDTPEERAQIEAEIKANKQNKNITELQKILAAQGAPTPTEKTAIPSTGKIYTAGDSIGVGVGQANKIPSVAVGGWSFTDKRTIQQLMNVPEGSTVQLYAGTNDATNKRLDPKVYEQRMAELKQIAEERGLKVSIHGPHQSPNQSWSENVGPVNEMMANAARNNGIRYVDNSSVTASARDNIHMSTGGYKELFTRGLEQTTPIETMADGGEKTVNEGEIRALPIGAMKNDNSVVVDKDSNPLFTMNTKDESANYDPRTGKVSVDPNAKDGETKSPDVAQTLENKAAMQQSVPQISPSSDKSSFDDMLNITDNLFKDPSFHRSMARSRFGSTADPALGGQFAASGTVS